MKYTVKQLDKNTASTRKFLESDELRELIDSMGGNTTYQLLTRFLVLSGVRVGEAFALTLKDVNMTAQSIVVDKTYSLTTKKVQTTKTEMSERVLHMYPELLAVVRSQLLHQKQICLAFGVRSQLLFPWTDGDHMHYEEYAKYFREHVVKIRGSALSIHSLRHTYTSLMEEAGVPIDSITFSGDGEPTLNPDFAKIIDITISLRDKWYPEARISVLSNATMAWKDDVFSALRKVDNPIMKLDAPTDALCAKINRPAPGYRVADVVKSLKRFDGDFVLQTMFLRSKDFDSSSREVLEGWMELVRELKPREIMVYTLDRPAPMQGLEKFTEEQMGGLVRPLSDEGFNIQIRG